MLEIIFDVETKSLFRDVLSANPEDLGVSLVSVYKREISNGIEIKGEIKSFWEKEFPDMWQIFREADRIIGFNSLNFDIPVLKPYAPSEFAHLHHFDILEEVKKSLGIRLSLNALAKDTLGKEKTDSGIQAVRYWRQGDPESLSKLQSYCEADVLLTRDLYDYGLKFGHLKYTDKWNNLRKFPVDFSYPPDTQADNQIKLF